jgi:hypothetical protein
LTQSCKQIREEFRPLWLRDAAIRLEIDSVEPFLATYYPNREEYQNAPRLILISWDHDEGYTEDLLFDVTPLLRLRASCSTFVAKFKCRAIIDGDLPNVECWECGHSIHCGCGDADCDHEDAVDEAFCDLLGEYHYTWTLDNFLANPNDSWLKAIRDDVRDAMKVECTVDVLEQRPTIHIRFHQNMAPTGFSKSTMFRDAGRYLRKMGMLDLDIHGKLDFIIGEATGKYTRHFEGCNYSHPTYNQVLLVNPVGSAKAAAKARVAAAVTAVSSTSAAAPGTTSAPASTSPST